MHYTGGVESGIWISVGVTEERTNERKRSGIIVKREYE